MVKKAVDNKGFRESHASKICYYLQDLDLYVFTWELAETNNAQL